MSSAFRVDHSRLRARWALRACEASCLAWPFLRLTDPGGPSRTTRPPRGPEGPGSSDCADRTLPAAAGWLRSVVSSGSGGSRCSSRAWPWPCSPLQPDTCWPPSATEVRRRKTLARSASQVGLRPNANGFRTSRTSRSDRGGCRTDSPLSMGGGTSPGWPLGPVPRAEGSSSARCGGDGTSCSRSGTGEGAWGSPRPSGARLPTIPEEAVPEHLWEDPEAKGGFDLSRVDLSQEQLRLGHVNPDPWKRLSNPGVCAHPQRPATHHAFLLGRTRLLYQAFGLCARDPMISAFPRRGIRWYGWPDDHQASSPTRLSRQGCEGSSTAWGCPTRFPVGRGGEARRAAECSRQATRPGWPSHCLGCPSGSPAAWRTVEDLLLRSGSAPFLASTGIAVRRVGELRSAPGRRCVRRRSSDRPYR